MKQTKAANEPMKIKNPFKASWEAFTSGNRPDQSPLDTELLLRAARPCVTLEGRREVCSSTVCVGGVSCDWMSGQWRERLIVRGHGPNQPHPIWKSSYRRRVWQTARERGVSSSSSSSTHTETQKMLIPRAYPTSSQSSRNWAHHVHHSKSLLQLWRGKQKCWEGGGQNHKVRWSDGEERGCADGRREKREDRYCVWEEDTWWRWEGRTHDAHRDDVTRVMEL